MNNDKVYAADAMKTIGFVPEYATGPNTNHEVRDGPRSVVAGRCKRASSRTM